MQNCLSNKLAFMKLKIFLPMIVLVSLITGCYYDVVTPADTNAPPQAVSFSGDLQPIFDLNCNKSGCHDGIAHEPDLTASNSYNSIISGGFVNTTIPTESILYQEVKSGSMPLGGAPLSADDTQKIFDWIRNGAPNN
jgi:hypothetical protein